MILCSTAGYCNGKVSHTPACLAIVWHLTHAFEGIHLATAIAIASLRFNLSGAMHNAMVMLVFCGINASTDRLLSNYYCVGRDYILSPVVCPNTLFHLRTSFNLLNRYRDARLYECNCTIVLAQKLHLR